MGIRDRMPDCSLRLWARREAPLALAREKGVTSHTFLDAREAVQGADLIILSTPIGVFEELVRRVLPAMSRHALVTDVGSVKAYVHRTTGALLTERGRLFIGSHPMAGAEKQGMESATPALLEGATVALTNAERVEEPMLRRLEMFWQQLGCRTYLMDPVNHDCTVARISHVPHILAGLCARNASQGREPMGDLQRLASSGFRDTTRVCSGPAGMWADILWENDVAVRESLHNCVEDLQRLIGLLEDQDRAGVREWLAQAKVSREMIRQEQSF